MPAASDPTSAPIGLTPAEFVERVGSAPVLDVRTPAEFADGHLAGATNVDVRDPGFAEQVEALGLPADAPVYLYCQAGGRAGQATAALQRLGYAGAVNAGGFPDLAEAGAEVA